MRRQTLARYTDSSGMEHALVLARWPGGGLLLLDRSPARVLVVAELSDEEGEEQALAVLRDWPGDPHAGVHSPPAEGYLRRAVRSQAPLCRPLRAEDLAAPAPGESEAEREAA